MRASEPRTLAPKAPKLDLFLPRRTRQATHPYVIVRGHAHSATYEFVYAFFKKTETRGRGWGWGPSWDQDDSDK